MIRHEQQTPIAYTPRAPRGRHWAALWLRLFSLIVLTVSLLGPGLSQAQLPDGLVVAQVTGSQGSSLGRFDNPVGVAVDSQDRIVVADTDNDRIQVCEAQGS